MYMSIELLTCPVICAVWAIVVCRACDRKTPALTAAKMTRGMSAIKT